MNDIANSAPANPTGATSSPPSSAPSPSTTTTTSTPTANASAPKTGVAVSGETSNDPDAGFDMFAGMGDTSFSEDAPDLPPLVGKESAPSTPKVETATAAPAPPAPATPPAAPSAAPPAADPSAPASQPAAATQEQPPTPSATPSPDTGLVGIDGVLAAFKDESKVVEALLPSFALSAEDLTALETDAAAHTPKLLARTMVRSVSAGLNYVKELVPMMVQAEIARVNRTRDTENAFFSKNSHLDRVKHGRDIIAFANTFRQMNPQITQDELFAKTAAAVSAMYGLSAAPPAQQTAVPSAAPVAAPPAQVVSTAPFAPAPSGVGAGVQPQNQPTGWEGLGLDLG